MDRAAAAEAIAALFEDGGHTVLTEGGGVARWEEALAPMPEGLFQLDGDPPALTMLTVARDLWNQAGDLRMATAVTRGLLGWLVEHRGPEHPDTYVELGALGFLALRVGREREGAEMLERAFVGLRSVVGGRDLRLAVVAGNLGLHHARAGDMERGEHLLEQAYKIRKKAAPATVGNVAGQLAEVRLRLGRVDGAIDCLRDAWMAELDAHGEAHPRTVQRARVLARALNQAGQYREAVAMWRGLDPMAAQAAPEVRAEIGFNLGVALYRSRKKDEGIRRITEAVRLTSGLEDGLHPELPERLTMLAQVRIDSRLADEAESLLYEAAELERRISGDTSAAAARRFVRLGSLIAQLGRYDEALGYLDSAASLLRSALGDAHADTQLALAAVVDVLVQKATMHTNVEQKREAAEVARYARDFAAVLDARHPSRKAFERFVTRHNLRL